MSLEGFSKPPSGKELTGDGIKDLVEKGKPASAPKMEDVAKVLGGTVDGTSAPEETEVKVTIEDPVVDGKVVDKDTQREYLRTLLAAEPFIKTYELFGGALVIKFKTRTTGENDMVDMNIRDSAYKELIEVKSYAIVRERLRIVTSCEKLIIGSTEAPAVDFKYFNDMDEPAFAAVRKAFRNFEDVCDVMFQRANDSNFWKGIVGAT